ncbi:VOC family protein [Aliiglaciecola sp. CAU 1673]|uniref:VOC family protein n=1 Tax=Aliiglaciecola sp. CAU 1673 TaxID=3032595 RepID=UPI0023DAF0FA|nr:VOC family protein [Aliiglaciecola sp. CAU 1673]MDF2179887.1 VOC family protein [Aliiglaciecola sp. CAU 1673]
MNPNPVGWFEIPVTDMERAKAFYQSAFGYGFEMMDMGPEKMAMFPFDHEQPNCSGALVKGAGYQPISQGILVYFSVEEVTQTLNKIEKAGGKTVQEKMPIGEHGFIGLFLDTEGNRLGLHSRE